MHTSQSSCAGAQGGGDRANINNILVSCGLMFGAARRTDNTDSAIFINGTRWSVPLLTCATVIKASIKSVKPETKGPGQHNASVSRISDKVYDNTSSAPLWGVDDLNYNLSDARPIWGLVSPSYENHPSISTLRRPHLYLPGYTLGEITSPVNLPGTTFHSVALNRAYDIGSGID
ncbi:hypothetical protein BDV12DRAFT_200244 [Aspergillus spectabilis]